MRRRDFIEVIGVTAAAWPLAARAQQAERARRIGVLCYYVKGDAEGQARIAAFRQSLRESGWIEGRNVHFDERWSDGEINRIRANAAEIVELKPDVIVATSSRETRQLQQQTQTIPIVFLGTSDPVGQGLIASLAQPGVNATGLALNEFSMIGKMLEILKEITPGVSRVGLIGSPDHPAAALIARSFETSAPSLSIKPMIFSVRTLSEIERAVEAVIRGSNGALLFPSDVTIKVYRDAIIALAAQHRVPAIYSDRGYVSGGGLVSYGTDLIDISRRGASYVDRILRGANPADLPVEQPTKYELAINLKTAKALGLTVPLIMQMTADEVIE